MSPAEQGNFAKIVQSIRSGNVPEWDRFLEALNQRASKHVIDLVASAPDRLQYNQGRAYEILDLVEQLKNAPQLADALYEKERNNGTTRR